MSGPFEDQDFDQAEDESFPPLPPPPSPGPGGEDPFGDGEEDGDLSKLADAPAAKRRTVRRPQPKLDSQRLTSERGLPALRTLFENVRFKGKGHEAEDLRVVMQKMENWAHRLHPKLQFEDFMEKVEKLGSKKDVQTCLKKIRLDMPLIHEDFIGREGEEETPPGQEEVRDPDPFGTAGAFPWGSQGPVHSTPAPTLTPAPTRTPAPTLTEEQQSRMELNKRLALERRLSRRPPADPPESQVSPQATSSQAVSPQATSSQAVSPQATSSQAVSPQATSSQAVSSQAVSPQATSSQAVSSQAVSSQAVSSQAVSSQAVSSQAVSSQAVSSQASPSHLPADSVPQSEPGPPGSRLQEVEPVPEAPERGPARASPPVAGPAPEEGEPAGELTAEPLTAGEAAALD